MFFRQVPKGRLVIPACIYRIPNLFNPILRPIHKQTCSTARSRDPIFKQMQKLRKDTKFLAAITCILVSALGCNSIARNSLLYAVEVIFDTIPLMDSFASPVPVTPKQLLQLSETKLVPSPKDLDASAAEMMSRNPPAHYRLVRVILRSQHDMRLAVMYCQFITDEMISLNIPDTTPKDHME